MVDTIKFLFGVTVKIACTYVFYSIINTNGYVFWGKLSLILIVYGLVAFVINALMLWGLKGVIVIIAAMVIQGGMPNDILRMICGAFYFIGALIMDVIYLGKCIKRG